MFARPSLFLVPVDKKNVARSVEHVIPQAEVETLLKGSKLSGEIRGHEALACWAFSQAKRRLFEDMKEGDYVVMSPTGTGEFRYIGKVVAKADAPDLACALWGTIEWRLVFFMTELKKTSVNKEAVLTAIDYDPRYRLMGSARVAEARVDRLISSSGGVSQFFAQFEV